MFIERFSCLAARFSKRVAFLSLPSSTAFRPLMAVLAAFKATFVDLFNCLAGDEPQPLALATLVVNTAKGIFKALVIKAPEYGEKQSEALHDIALRTGATLISKNTGIELAAITLSNLGKAKK